MLRRVSWLSAPAVRLVLALLSFTALAIPWAQGVDLNDGFDALDREYRKSKDTIQKLFKGAEVADPKNPQHEKAVDVAAQNTTYYFTHPRSEEPGGIDRLITTFEGELSQLIKAKASSAALASMYSRRIVFRGQEVLYSSRQDVKPLARVNVTRVMARLAERGPNETADDVAARLGGSAAGEL